MVRAAPADAEVLGSELMAMEDTLVSWVPLDNLIGESSSNVMVVGDSDGCSPSLKKPKGEGGVADGVPGLCRVSSCDGCSELAGVPRTPTPTTDMRGR